MKANRKVIDAALIAAGYAATEAGFLQYADDKFTPETEIGLVIEALDPQWKRPIGVQGPTVADVEFLALFDVETIDTRDAGDYVGEHTDAADNMPR